MLSMQKTNEDNLQLVNVSNTTTFGTSGLKNLNNTCYMNSIIQCLSNCSKLKEFIIKCDFIRSDKIKNCNDIDSKLIYQMFRLLKEIWNSSFEEFQPKTFRKLFGVKYDLFRGSLQQDSQEALICILDTFHNEIVQNVILKYNEKNLINDELLKLTDYNTDEDDPDIISKKNYYYNNHLKDFVSISGFNFIKNYLQNNFSFISHLFQGFFISELICPITNKSKYLFDPYFFWSVSIPEDSIDSYDEEDESESESTDSSKNKNTDENITNTKNESSEENSNDEKNIDSENEINNLLNNDDEVNSKNQFSLFIDSDDENNSELQELLHYDNNSIESKNDCTNKEYKLEECLDLFIEEEILDDNNKWYSCFAKTHVNAKKRMYIWKPPKILVIHIKRFKKNEISVEKKTNKIVFPFKNLNIKKYIHKFSDDEDYLYDLFAINNHTNFSKFSNYNSINFGHYWSFCKNDLDDNWYEYDDDDVKIVSEDFIKNKMEYAYILFYVLKN